MYILNKRIVLISLLSVFFLIVLYSAYWLFERGRVVFRTDSSTTVTIRLQGSDYTTISEINDGSTLTLKSGRYEIESSGDIGRTIALVDVGRFFSVTETNFLVNSLRSISFIASDAGTCGLSTGVYYSYTCEASTNTIKEHIPSADLSPSYTRVVSSAKDLGTTGNIFKTNGKLYTIIQSNDQRSFGRNNLYEVVTTSENLVFKKIKELPVLASDSVYIGEEYLNGFIAYTRNIDRVYFFDNINSEGDLLEEFSLGEFRELSSGSLDVMENKVLVAANNSTEINSQDNVTLIKIKDQKVSTFEYNGILDSVSFCGIDKICAINNGVFKMLSTDSGLREVFQVSDVSRYNYDDTGGLYIVKGDTLYSFNVESLAGRALVSHKGFETVSLFNDPTTERLVQVVANSELTSALVINDSDSLSNIFPVLSDLSTANIINGLSVYNNSVYITPFLGDLEFIPSEGVFDYNPARKAQANNLINSIINSSDYSTQGYKFINLIK